MVRSVVLDKNSFPGEVGSGDLLQIGQVCFGIKDLREFIEESGSKELYGTKNLQALPLTCYGDKRLAS